MQLEECLAEASREGRSRLCNTALCTGQLGCETREEVILGLLRAQDRYWRQYSEGISREEDNVLGSRTCRYRSYDLLDVVDRIRDTGVLSNALVGEVNLAVSVYSNVLEEGVTTDSVVDIGLRVLVEVDNLGLAAAFAVEYALVVPAVLVVTDKETLRIGRKSSLAGA